MKEFSFHSIQRKWIFTDHVSDFYQRIEIGRLIEEQIVFAHTPLRKAFLSIFLIDTVRLKARRYIDENNIEVAPRCIDQM